MGISLRDFKFPEGQFLGNIMMEMQNDNLRSKVNYNFASGIVTDVISNPYEFLNRKVDNNLTIKDLLKLSSNQSDLNVRFDLINKELAEYMPMNSAFVNLIDNNDVTNKIPPVLCYPFFPSHLSLPLKPGEHVWLLVENIKDINYYYWICRKIGAIQIEDVNYTNLERTKDISAIQKLINGYNDTKMPSKELFENAVSFNNATSNSNKTIEEIFLNTKAYNDEFVGEPVPRVAKKCSDLLIQGSNNSGIHLTTEKFSIEQDDSPLGSIDIFVNRKDDSLKSNKISLVKNKIENNPGVSYFEIDKHADIKNKNTNEFDKEIYDDQDDSTDVSARLYLTSNCNFDDVFKTSIDEKYGLEKLSGSAAILFGKNCRIVSEKDIRIVSQAGKSYIGLDALGDINIKTIGQMFFESNTVNLKGDDSVNINGNMIYAKSNNSLSAAGPVLSVKPILDFIDVWKSTPPPGKLALLSPLGPAAAAALPIIEGIISSGAAENIILKLSTKTFYAE